nr:hypothetical protein [Paenibacillus dendritiformis]
MSLRFTTIRDASKALADGRDRTDSPEAKRAREKSSAVVNTEGLLGEWGGFYVHAPKQKGNVKQRLGYIGRYSNIREKSALRMGS